MQIQCLRKLEYYIRSIKKGYFKQKCQASEKYVSFYALNTWLGLLLHECSGVMEAQVALIAAFMSSALLGLVYFIFLLTIPQIFSMWFRSGTICCSIKHSNTIVTEPAFGTFGSVGRCQVLLENEISIAIKLVSKWKHEVL